MKITIFGSGYVGLVTGACFADAGNHVVCVDVDAAKIARLQKGDVPIHEPGFEALIRKNSAAGRMKFTTDAAEGVAHAGLARRRTDRDDLEDAVRNTLGRVRRELHAASSRILADQGLEARLMDGNVALLQARDLRRIDIHADDVIAGVGKTGPGDETDVA